MKITYADFDGFGDLPHKSSGISTLKHIVLQHLTRNVLEELHLWNTLNSLLLSTDLEMQ